MEIVDLTAIMSRPLVVLDPPLFQSKQEVFDFCVPKLKEAGVIQDEMVFYQALQAREEQASTYMGSGIALPHGKSETVQKAAICFCRCHAPFAYQSHGETGQARYVFLLAIPQSEANDGYLRILAKLAGLLMYPEFLQCLDCVQSYQEVIDAIRRFEGQKDKEVSL